jgi:hypothetical protein
MAAASTRLAERVANDRILRLNDSSLPWTLPEAIIPSLYGTATERASSSTGQLLIAYWPVHIAT